MKNDKTVEGWERGPVPTYQDWTDEEEKASDRCLMDVGFLIGTEAMVYGFTSEYKKACEVIENCRPRYCIDTDRGLIFVEARELVIQKKNWLQRHFPGCHGDYVSVGFNLRGSVAADGKVKRIQDKWTAVANIENIVQYAAEAALQERLFAEELYRKEAKD